MAEQLRLEADFRVRQYLGPYVNRSERKSRSRESCRRYLATFGATANPGIEHQVAGWLVVELQVSRPLGIGDVPMHELAGGGKAVTGAQGRTGDNAECGKVDPLFVPLDALSQGDVPSTGECVVDLIVSGIRRNVLSIYGAR